MITELDAVNQILAGQGLSPVLTLEGDLPKDAVTAKNTLNQVRRQLCLESWNFNIDPEYTLSVNTDGEIPYPSSLLRFAVSGEEYILQKSGRLYNRKDKTYGFTSARTGFAQFLLEWDELPPEAQNYCANRAARMVYEQFLGTDDTRQQLFLEEQTARTQLEQRDAEVSKYNMLDEASLPAFYGSSLLPGYTKKRIY